MLVSFFADQLNNTSKSAALDSQNARQFRTSEIARQKTRRLRLTAAEPQAMHHYRKAALDCGTATVVISCLTEVPFLPHN